MPSAQHTEPVADLRGRDVDVQWTVVAQNTMGSSRLFHVCLRAEDTGEVVFQKLRKEYWGAVASSCKDGWISRIFTTVFVGSAELQWVRSKHYEKECTS